MNAYYPKTPKDVIRRNEYMDKTESEIDAMIKKTVKAINNKLYRLEKQGLTSEAFAYKRLTEWTQNVFNSNRVSVKGVSKTAPKKMKANYLIQLEKYNKWHLTKTQVNEDRARLLSQLEVITGKHITDDEAREFGKAINLVMRGDKDHPFKLSTLMGSSEIREMVLSNTINSDIVNKEDSKYISGLAEYVKTLIPPGISLTPNEADYRAGMLRDFLKSYDSTLDRFLDEEEDINGDIIVYDRLTGEYLYRK